MKTVVLSLVVLLATAALSADPSNELKTDAIPKSSPAAGKEQTENIPGPSANNSGPDSLNVSAEHSHGNNRGNNREREGHHHEHHQHEHHGHNQHGTHESRNRHASSNQRHASEQEQAENTPDSSAINSESASLNSDVEHSHGNNRGNHKERHQHDHRGHNQHGNHQSRHGHGSSNERGLLSGQSQKVAET